MMMMSTGGYASTRAVRLVTPQHSFSLTFGSNPVLRCRLAPASRGSASCVSLYSCSCTDKHMYQPALAVTGGWVVPLQSAGMLVRSAPFPHLCGVTGELAGHVPGKVWPSHILRGLAAAAEAVEVCIRQHLLTVLQTRHVPPGSTNATANPRIFTATSNRCILEPADLHAEMRAALRVGLGRHCCFCLLCWVLCSRTHRAKALAHLLLHLGCRWSNLVCRLHAVCCSTLLYLACLSVWDVGLLLQNGSLEEAGGVQLLDGRK